MLYVEGRLVSGSRKIANYLFTVYTAEQGRKTDIATMSGTLYRTGKHLEQPDSGSGHEDKHC